MSPASRTSSAAGADSRAEYADRSRSEISALLPPPRKAGILQDPELISNGIVKSLSVVSLFRTEPLLKGKCCAYCVREDGCPWDMYNYCVNALREAPSIDPRDLAQALRRAMARRAPATGWGRQAVGANAPLRRAAQRRSAASTATAAATSRSSGGTEVVTRGGQRSRETWHITARLARPSYQRHPRSRRVRRR